MFGLRTNQFLLPFQLLQDALCPSAQVTELADTNLTAAVLLPPVCPLPLSTLCLHPALKGSAVCR